MEYFICLIESEDLSVLLRSRNYGLWGKRIGAALCVVLPLAINVSTLLTLNVKSHFSSMITTPQFPSKCGISRSDASNSTVYND